MIHGKLEIFDESLVACIKCMNICNQMETLFTQNKMIINETCGLCHWFLICKKNDFKQHPYKLSNFNLSIKIYIIYNE